jgi:hypothetical protein
MLSLHTDLTHSEVGNTAVHPTNARFLEGVLTPTHSLATPVCKVIDEHRFLEGYFRYFSG